MEFVLIELVVLDSKRAFYLITCVWVKLSSANLRSVGFDIFGTQL